MSYKSTVVCDRCGHQEIAPNDGGFPAQWAEVNRKPSFRGTQPMEKTKRRHLCADCADAFDGWMAHQQAQSTA